MEQEPSKDDHFIAVILYSFLLGALGYFVGFQHNDSELLAGALGIACFLIPTINVLCGIRNALAEKNRFPGEEN